MEQAVNYLTILLQDNENLKNMLSAYLNSILNTIASHTKEEEESNEAFAERLMKTMSQTEREQILSVISMFRAYATRANISFTSIEKKVPVNPIMKQQLISDYKIIKTNPMPSFDNCERFVMNMNDFLGDAINLQAMLNSKQKQNDLAKAAGMPNIQG